MTNSRFYKQISKYFLVIDWLAGDFPAFDESFPADSLCAATNLTNLSTVPTGWCYHSLSWSFPSSFSFRFSQNDHISFHPPPPPHFLQQAALVNSFFRVCPFTRGEHVKPLFKHLLLPVNFPNHNFLKIFHHGQIKVLPISKIKFQD